MSAASHLPATDYEPRDASPHRLLLVAAGLALGLVVSLGLSAWLYARHYRETPPLGTVGRQTSFRHSPNATTDIAADWKRLDAETHAHLDTYGWIDRDAGIVRIPIDVAMHRLVGQSAAQANTPK